MTFINAARPVSPSPVASLPRPSAMDPRITGEDPARIRATIARAPLFAALPISNGAAIRFTMFSFCPASRIAASKIARLKTVGSI